MSAFSYLIIRSSINWIKKLKEKPGAIVLIIVVVIFLSISLFSSPDVGEQKELGNINILYLISFAIGLFFVIMAIYAGLSTGTSFFNMADVNLLFTSPMSSNKTLIYGIVKQMGKSLFISVFMIFQIMNLRNNFGLKFQESLFIIFLYMILVFTMQIVTLGVYSYANGNRIRRNVVKYTTMVLSLLVAAYVLYGIYAEGTEIIQNIVIYLFPVAGWFTGMLVTFIGGNTVLFLIFACLFALYIFFTVFALIRWKPDYYEDCLINSENTYHAKQMMKGDRSAQANIRKKSRHKNTFSMQFKGGSGASTFIYRHMVEIKRTNKAYLFGISSILYLGLGIACGFLSRAFGHEVVFAFFGIACYLNMFLVGITRVSQELSRQFIYLVPDSAFKKLFYASFSSLFRPITDAFLIFLPPIFVAGFSFPQSIFIITAYASVCSIYIASNIVMYALFGKFSNSVFIIFAYFILSTMLLIPAAAAGVVSGLIFSSPATGFAFASFVNYSIYLLMLFICRNMVHNIDFK